MIWSYLDFLDMTRCAQVCKVWRDFLTTGMNKALWRTLHFDKARKKVNIQALSCLLKYSDYDTRALIVDNCKRALFGKEKLKSVLLSARNLERLELRQPMEAMPLPVGGASVPGRKIRHLVLDGFNGINLDPEKITIPAYLRTFKDLKHLELLNSHQFFGISEPQGPITQSDEPRLPRLKHLRISPNLIQRVDIVSYLPFIPRCSRCGVLRVWEITYVTNLHRSYYTIPPPISSNSG